MVKFRFENVSQGLTVSIGVEVSAAGLLRAYQHEESFLVTEGIPAEVIDAMCRALQLAAVEVLHRAGQELPLCLLESGVKAMRENRG